MNTAQNFNNEFNDNCNPFSGTGAGESFGPPRFGRGGPPWMRQEGPGSYGPPQFGPPRRGRGGPGGRGPGGPGRGGRFGGPGGPGGRGGRGRVGRGQIRTALLALLVDEPMHGYEMIRTLDEKSGGRWKPSPGAVYPTLAQLTDEGLVTAEETGGKRVFSLTDEGRALVETLSANDREPWESGGDTHPAFELRGLVQQIGMATRSLAIAGTAEQHERAKVILANARRSLYAILAEDPAEAGDSTSEDDTDA